MTTIAADLVESYRQTHFRVLTETPFVVKIEESSNELRQLHEDAGVECSAFLTAYNPFSQPLTDAENQARQTKLRGLLAEAQLQVRDGFGEDPTGQWPGEPSLLALGLSRDETIELGHLFDQNAVVWSGVDGVPELILLR